MNETASISVLPEVSLSEILSLTSPRNACRAAAVSKEFKSAADSDTVWKRFLPPDYDEVIAQAVSPVAFDSQKKLYLHLSDSHILLDRGYLVNRSSLRSTFFFIVRYAYISFSIYVPSCMNFSPKSSTHELLKTLLGVR